MRLDALLALNLGCSKTKARDVLAAGRVRGADGAPLTDARADVAATALPFAVTFDDAPLSLAAVAHVLLHKPVGCVTALDDARHPTAYALLEDAPLFAELRPVGRLDLDTSGLLLWTTEGAWLQRLTHPKHAVPRTYHAALARPFAAPPAAGLTLDDGHRPNITALAPLASSDAHPALVIPEGVAPEAFATITIVGGAYHEVRRIFAALGSHVHALCRVSFGRLELPRDLAAGAWRTIDPSSV
ncbi:MAG TPA: pseudouridine synthase [Polyangia bacterium]|nr:pseudouridine synthase [Polyangia bacterium]